MERLSGAEGVAVSPAGMAAGGGMGAGGVGGGSGASGGSAVAQGVAQAAELVRVLQSMIDVSAERLEGLRTHCATSAELTQNEIRILEVYTPCCPLFLCAVRIATHPCTEMEIKTEGRFVC